MFDDRDTSIVRTDLCKKIPKFSDCVQKRDELPF